MTQYIDLKTLDPSHPLRNRPLVEIGAEFLWAGRPWKPSTRRCHFNALPDKAQELFDWRAPMETKT